MNLFQNTKTNWKYIIFISLFAVIFSAGALVYQYWWLPKEEANMFQVQKVQYKQNETAEWKIYRNEQLGFEISYPSQWVIFGTEEEKDSYGGYKYFYVKFGDEKEVEINKERQAGEIKCAVTAGISNNVDNLTVSDWAIKKWGNPEDLELGKIENIKINNLEGIKYEFMSMGLETNILFSKNDKIINITTTFGDCEDLPVIFDQMLSTLKIIN
jgi:hypothetical protein